MIRSLPQTMFEIFNLYVVSEIWGPENYDKTVTAFDRGVEMNFTRN
jgi:hypothetical protein